MPTVHSIQKHIGDSIYARQVRESIMAQYGITVSYKVEGFDPLQYNCDGIVAGDTANNAESTVIVNMSRKALDLISQGEGFTECRKKGEIVIEGNYSHWGLLVGKKDMAGARIMADRILDNMPSELARYPRVRESLEMIACHRPFNFDKNQFVYSVIPGYKHTPWLDEQSCELTQLVKDFIPAIREEAYQLIDDHHLSKKGKDDPAWEVDTYPLNRWPLFRYQNILHDRCKHFPETERFLKKAIDSVRLVSASFLVTHPDNTVPWHSDGNSLFCSWHAGIIASGDNGLNMAGKTWVHTENECILWEDGFNHCAWNKSTRPRVMLATWITHPEWSADEARLLLSLAAQMRLPIE